MPGMRGVTVRQLQIFTAASSQLSFSQTSKALHLTQPAVSMQIRQLEESAGLPLFERVGKGLQLTQARRCSAAPGRCWRRCARRKTRSPR